MTVVAYKKVNIFQFHPKIKAVVYSGPCQTSKIEFLGKIININNLLTILQNTPSYMFERVLNRPLKGNHKQLLAVSYVPYLI